MFRVILASILLSGCWQHLNEWGDIAKEFRAEYPEAPRIHAKFVSATHMPLVTEFGSGVVRPAHAYCDLRARVIYVNGRWWDTATIWEKRKVYWHEMGHCWLNLKHETAPGVRDIMTNRLDSVDPDGANWEALKGRFKRGVLKHVRQ